MTDKYLVGLVTGLWFELVGFALYEHKMQVIPLIIIVFILAAIGNCGLVATGE